jgi:hypothetical protein
MRFAVFLATPLFFFFDRFTGLRLHGMSMSSMRLRRLCGVSMMDVPARTNLSGFRLTADHFLPILPPKPALVSWFGRLEWTPK